jgi:hypothetical protein
MMAIVFTGHILEFMSFDNEVANALGGAGAALFGALLFGMLIVGSARPESPGAAPAITGKAGRVVGYAFGTATALGVAGIIVQVVGRNYNPGGYGLAPVPVPFIALVLALELTALTLLLFGHRELYRWLHTPASYSVAGLRATAVGLFFVLGGALSLAISFEQLDGDERLWAQAVILGFFFGGIRLLFRGSAHRRARVSARAP